jgi:hypothetical protein
MPLSIQEVVANTGIIITLNLTAKLFPDFGFARANTPHEMMC